MLIKLDNSNKMQGKNNRQRTPVISVQRKNKHSVRFLSEEKVACEMWHERQQHTNKKNERTTNIRTYSLNHFPNVLITDTGKAISRLSLYTFCPKFN